MLWSSSPCHAKSPIKNSTARKCDASERLLVWCCKRVKGSLTSSAKKVLLADIQVQVGDAQHAIFNVGFLLCTIADVANVSLALVRGISSHDGILNHL